MVSTTVLQKVLNTAVSVASHSWEWGTVSEALLEWQNPDMSIWHNPFPNGEVPKLNVEDVEALRYAKPHIETDGNTLVKDGAAGDPASLGIPALLIGKSDQQYYDAAFRQLEHLTKRNPDIVPRWPNDAISHREGYAELWADFIYMVPPFFAYAGVATDDVGLLKEAANQCRLYHEVLETQEGPWLHIVGLEKSLDPGLWSTSNAWAMAGMSRVIATMRKSKYDAETKGEQGMLTGFIKDIIDGSIKLDVDKSGLLRNVLNDSNWFGEISGTSLIAATTLRMAVLEPETFGTSYTDWAAKKMEVVDSKIDETTGIVAPAINPLKWADTVPSVTGSPEGQAFVILLHAAYRDWEGE